MGYDPGALRGQSQKTAQPQDTDTANVPSEDSRRVGRGWEDRIDGAASPGMTLVEGEVGVKLMPVDEPGPIVSTEAIEVIRDTAEDEHARAALRIAASSKLTAENADEVIATAFAAYQRRTAKEAERLYKSSEEKDRNRAPKVAALLHYVPAHIKVLMFRRDHPDGLLVPWITADDEHGVIVWSYVYLHRDDLVRDEQGRPGGRYAALNMKELAMDTGYREKAITGAHGRALADLGYGTVYGIASAEDMVDLESGARPQTLGQERNRAQPQQAKLEAAPRPTRVTTQSAEAAGFEQYRDELEDARNRFRAHIAKSKLYTAAQVEAKYGPIEKMRKDDMRAAYAALTGCKTKKQADELLGGPAMSVARLWRNAAGGTQKEQALCWLQGVLDICTEEQHQKLVLDAQSAVHRSIEELELLPADDQVDQIMDSLVRKLGKGEEFYREVQA